MYYFANLQQKTSSMQNFLCGCSNTPNIEQGIQFLFKNFLYKHIQKSQFHQNSHSDPVSICRQKRVWCLQSNTYCIYNTSADWWISTCWTNDVLWSQTYFFAAIARYIPKKIQTLKTKSSSVLSQPTFERRIFVGRVEHTTTEHKVTVQQNVHFLFLYHRFLLPYYTTSKSESFQRIQRQTISTSFTHNKHKNCRRWSKTMVRSRSLGREAIVAQPRSRLSLRSLPLNTLRFATIDKLPQRTSTAHLFPPSFSERFLTGKLTPNRQIATETATKPSKRTRMPSTYSFYTCAKTVNLTNFCVILYKARVSD